VRRLRVGGPEGEEVWGSGGEGRCGRAGDGVRGACWNVVSTQRGFKNLVERGVHLYYIRTA
jgi:hypothetical protein